MIFLVMLMESMCDKKGKTNQREDDENTGKE
jgi:hypothetical protein